MAAGDLLIKTLEQATSQDPHILKAAEEQLKAWELQPNFFQAILSACYNQDLQVQIRWLAILYFKNGVDRHWRSIVKRIISEDEKKLIRDILISNFSEPVYQVSLQLAVVTGRIARTDLRLWPNLVPTLLQEVRSDDLTIQHNALLTLNQVIKGLMSKRLASDRKVFKEISLSIFTFVFELFVHSVNDCGQCLEKEQINDGQEPAVVKSIMTSVITLKVLRKLLIEGSTSTEGNSPEGQLLWMVVERIPFLLNMRARHVRTVKDKLQSLITNGMKLLLETQTLHPLLLAHVLENTLKLAINYVFNQAEKELVFETFVVQCSNLIRSIIKCNKYKNLKGSKIEDNVDALALKAHEVKQEILSPEVTRQFCEQLILTFFPLKAKELEDWENDPENYMSLEAGDSDSYLLRPSIESLFLCLYYEHRSIFTTVISELVRSLNGPAKNDNMDDILKRDAVYFALGLSSYELFGDLDFDTFFQEILISELNNTSPRMKIIHRRVLWLIGRWIDVSFTRESRRMLYEVLSRTLSTSQDIVVRATAAQTLRDAIDDCQLNKDDFVPFLKVIWDGLFRLLVDLQECDTKMNVLNVISILIERMGNQIKPLSNSLCDYLPHLWADSAEHNMLRCLVVTALAHLVEALGPDSTQLHHFLLPVIQLSTDLRQPSHVFLLDDGLELWLQLMQNTSSLTDELLIMFNILPAFLEQVSENFKICVAIMESYVIMDAVKVLQVHSQSLITVFGSLIGQMKVEGNVLLAELIQQIFIALPVHGPYLFEGIMVELFKIIIADEEYPQVVTAYLSLLGYTILNNLTIFNQIVQKACQELSANPEQIAGSFIDIWLDKVDCMTKEEPRKLTAMALVSLLPLNASFVNERFGLILDTTVNVMHDMAKVAPDADQQSNSLSEERLGEDDNLEIHRRNMLQSQNPVFSVSLVDFVKQKLAASRNVVGPENFKTLMETMDGVVTQQLMSLIS